MKGKVGEALSRGLPVVTTAIGAEGMALVDGEHALVANGPEAFADAVVRLHQDPALWERLAGAGRRHVDAQYGPEAVAAALRDIVRRARAGELGPAIARERVA